MTLTFHSDFDEDKLQKFFTRVIELGKMSNARATVTPIAKAGRKATVSADIVRWVSHKTRAQGFNPSQCAQELGLLKSTVWRTFQRMVKSGMIIRDEQANQVVNYRRAPKAE